MQDKSYYEKIGFKCGLEIHQRIASQFKLFCSCSSSFTDDKIIGSITRSQRAVAGETGHLDVATQFESMKSRKFVYNLYENSTCLVDIDEEPPHEVNKEAMEFALSISNSLNAKIPYEIEPMRKEVVDGSDPSAFQRSMLIGYGGFLDLNGIKIEVPSIFLEEESSGVSGTSGNAAIYDVSRLGIPLIEIDTSPTIRTPQEAKTAAKELGLLLRLTGKVQRGIGSIRQDVNVSVLNGNRVEIKGVQNLDQMDIIIENEVERQLALLKIAEELKAREASICKPIEVTKLFSNSKARIIREKISSGCSVIAARLSGYAGLIGMETGKGMRLGRELSEYAKSIGLKGIIHGDENLSSYGFSEAELSSLGKELGLKAGDSFVMVAEEDERAKLAIKLVLDRAEKAKVGVLQETRAIEQGKVSTRFLRPIPGGSRMYPETDILPINPLHYSKKSGPEKATNVLDRLEKEIGVKQLAEQMLWSKELSQYSEIVEKTGAEPLTVATILLEKLKELRRSGKEISTISNAALVHIFDEYAKGTITRQAIEAILSMTPKTSADVDNIIKEEGLKRISGQKLKRLIEEYDGSKVEKIRAIMSKHRLNVDGKELNEMLK